MPVQGEFKTIQKIKEMLLPLHRKDVKVGIGDDCSVLDIGLEKEYLLLGSDSIVEGKHFLYNMPDRSLIGRKAVGAALSDVAAMGGYPLFLTVDLGVPNYLEREHLEEIVSGMRFLLDLFDVDVVGGDTVKSDVLYLSVSVVGKVEKEKVVLRSGAKKSDWIWVSGPLGGSLYRRHLLVSPRIPEARFLVQNFTPTAMIDISDGLVKDLFHILEESNVVAELVKEKIPVHKDAKNWEEALYMGEDFELLFTLSEYDSQRMLASIGALPYRFYPIGKVVDSGAVGLYLRDGRNCYPLSPKGYEHF